MEGLLLFYKPKNFSSYDIVRFLKNKFKVEKIGHGGSLDVLAQGLLILGISRNYTKNLNIFLKNSEKEYEAVLKLGYISDTFDAEGKIKEFRKDLSYLNINLFNQVIKLFLGEIFQTPPKYSALKVKGEPAYKLVRKNKDFELEPRKVFIKNIEILDFKIPFVKLRIVCGSGVYIRSLVNDLGYKLNCGAYLFDLLRVRINGFFLKESLTFDDFQKNYLSVFGKVYGKVQGVGFRYFVFLNARKLNLTGWVKNKTDGSLEFFVQGNFDKVLEILKLVKKGPIFSQVLKTEFIFKKEDNNYKNFLILKNKV